jgi:uncharacterized protein YcnI
MHRTRPTTSSPRPARRARHIGASIAALAAVALAASPAGAHVEPTTTEVPAASEATVAFTVQHGCDGSPTTKLEFQVPDAVTDATPIDKAGWESSVDGQVITFEGGPLADDVEDDFSVRFSVPDAPGTTLTFPFLQTCEQGSIDWIQLDPDGDRPAPVVEIGDADPSAPSTTAPPATQPTEPTTDPEGTEPEGTGSTSITLEASTTEPAGSTADDEVGDDEGSTNAGLVGAIGVLLVTVIGVGVVIARRRGTA